MRPATASLVMGGFSIWPSACRDTSRCVLRNAASAAKCSGTSPRKSRGAVHPGGGGSRGEGGAGVVGVVEAGAPGGGGVLTVVGALLRPGRRGVGGTNVGEQCGDGVGLGCR